jgi:integrase
MASLEKRNGRFRLVFRLDGAKISRTLRTRVPKEAEATLARLEDNLRRLELGLLTLPNDADPVVFLLSDGRVSEAPRVGTVRTLRELFDRYLGSIPTGALEEATIAGMKIHIAHLYRILGERFSIQGLALPDLQSYVERRSQEAGLRGGTVRPATLKKEIVTLRTAWNWAVHAKLVRRPFPTRGLHYPKTTDKPPFQTFSEIEQRVALGGLTPEQEAALWDCAFLTTDELANVLEHVKVTARHRFIHPMFVFAAHTGARRSEILRARLEDVDFRSHTILIRERKRVRGHHSTRRVPQSPLLEQTLTNWIREHPGGVFLFAQAERAPRSRKASSNPEPLTIHEAHDHFKRTLTGSKWDKLRGWHVFRHSFCSNCAARGIDQRVINTWVGHQTEEMVQRYRHLIPNQQQEAIRSVFG